MEERIKELEQLLEWYNNYCDFVEYNHRNVNNNAIDYANRMQE